jgi:hypothetical protein
MAACRFAQPLGAARGVYLRVALLLRLRIAEAISESGGERRLSRQAKAQARDHAWSNIGNAKFENWFGVRALATGVSEARPRLACTVDDGS